MNLKRCLVLLIVFCCLLFPFTAYATGGSGGGNGGGNGSGSGSGSSGGNNSTDALALSSSTPANGAHDVKLPVQINLTFANNVVNMNVKDENIKCFSLTSSDGTSIPVDVKMADDQVEPDKKRDVVLVPKQDLKLNTEYTVTISSALKSKNGDTLGKDVKVTFDTGKPAGSNTVSSNTASSTGSSNTSNNTGSSAGNNTASNKTSNTGTNVVLLVIAVAAGATLGVIRKRKK